MALGASGDVAGYDCDPVAALFASENVRRRHRNGPCTGRVACADACSPDVRGCAAWHIDPDRRDHGRRTVDPARMSPSCESIERLLAANGNAAVKLAPATAPPASWQARAELEWISRGRECRQLVAWFGRLAHSPGRRRAMILSRQGDVVAQVDGSPRPLPHPARSVGDYICEPDPAVLAAGLAGHVALAHELEPLAPEIPYFTCDSPVGHAAVVSFRVESVLPYDERRLASALREMGVGKLEIKHRGVRLAPEALRRRLRLSGERAAVVLISQHGGRNVAIIATRVERADAAEPV